MIGTLTAIGGANKLIGNPIGSIGGKIGGKIIGGIGGAIGSIFGNGRKEKRKKREEYRNALKGAGVSWSVIGNWHSDDHAAGQSLVTIVNEGKQKGVNYINKHLTGKVTSGKTRQLLNEFREWHKSQIKDNTQGTESPGGSTAKTAGLSISAIAGGLGALYAAKKLILD